MKAIFILLLIINGSIYHSQTFNTKEDVALAIQYPYSSLSEQLVKCAFNDCDLRLYKVDFDKRKSVQEVNIPEIIFYSPNGTSRGEKELISEGK